MFNGSDVALDLYDRFDLKDLNLDGLGAVESSIRCHLAIAISKGQRIRVEVWGRLGLVPPSARQLIPNEPLGPAEPSKGIIRALRG